MLLCHPEENAAWISMCASAQSEQPDKTWISKYVEKTTTVNQIRVTFMCINNLEIYPICGVGTLCGMMGMAPQTRENPVWDGWGQPVQTLGLHLCGGWEKQRETQNPPSQPICSVWYGNLWRRCKHKSWGCLSVDAHIYARQDGAVRPHAAAAVRRAQRNTVPGLLGQRQPPSVRPSVRPPTPPSPALQVQRKSVFLTAPSLSALSLCGSQGWEERQRE